MTDTEFRQFIVTWVKQASPGIRIIRANENGTRPPLPFVTYEVTTKTKLGQSQVSKADTNGDVEVKQHKDVIVRLNGYGNLSEELLSTLQGSLQLESIKALFVQNCVAIRIDNASITQLPVVLEETIERRFTYEPTFGYAQEVKDNTSYIETVWPIVDNSTINPPQ